MARKPASTFYFKKFSIKHDISVHKVGTDGVLLGAWAEVGSARAVLDIGTGTGLIALMLAQRTSNEVTIDAIDIAEEEIKQATENVAASPWANRIHAVHARVQDYEKSKYDLIVSNPPYFINSAKSPSADRSRARHTDLLPLHDLIFHSKRLLSPQGKLCVVIPPIEGNMLVSLAENCGLHTTRICAFKARQNKPIERLLIQFNTQPAPLIKEDLILYQSGEIWTEAYKNLTGEFYLNA